MELLNIQEQERLKECELVIKTGIQTFYQVGQALAEIRESKLYRHEFNTFEEYCDIKWNFSGRYARSLMTSFNVIENLKSGTIVPLPENLGQTKYLAQLDTDLRLYVWNNIINTFETITGKVVEQEVKKHKQLNEAVKEVKSKPMLYQFETQEELIKVAKDLLPVPAPVEVVKEVVKEIEVIKDGELVDKIAEKENQINDLETYVNQLRNSLSDKNKSLSELEKIKSEKYSLERQLHTTKQELQKLESLNINEDKVNETMQKLISFEQRQKQMAETITLSNEMINVIVDSRKFFSENLLILNKLTTTPDSLDNVRNQSSELINIVENWLTEFKQKFFYEQSNKLMVI